MAEQHLTLALNFIKEEPLQACRILELSDLRKAVSFIENLPPDYTAMLLACMVPFRAAKITTELNVGNAAGFLARMETEALVRILRMMEDEQRAGILRDLPKKKRDACALLLNFSSRTVGAWMTPHVIQAPLDFTVAQVMKYVKSSADKSQHTLVYGVDDDGVLHGNIDYSDLLNADDDFPVKNLLVSPVYQVRATMMIDQAENLPDWNHTDVLAVTDRHNKLLGVLAHKDMRRAVREINRNSGESSRGADLLPEFTGIYRNSLLILCETVYDVLKK